MCNCKKVACTDVVDWRISESGIKKRKNVEWEMPNSLHENNTIPATLMYKNVTHFEEE